MAAGDVHLDANGQPFVETLAGPLLPGVCSSCGSTALVTQEPVARPVCSTCGRARHGADLAYYGTGRKDLIKQVDSPELQRLRAEAAKRRSVEKVGGPSRAGPGSVRKRYGSASRRSSR